MRKGNHIKIFFLLSLMGMSSCNGADFKGSETKADPAASPSGAPPADQPDPTALPQGCVDGDVAKLSFPKDIQDCIDQGKLWNFDSKQCTSMHKSSFECTFDNLVKAVTDLGLKKAPGQVQDAKNKNAKLIGCGQSADGRVIVPQWVYPNESGQTDCKYASTPGLIFTACYANYGDKPQPTITTKADEEAYVLKCMTDND